MRVKKFHAKDMPEAMKMVKAELGPDAIILHSRDRNKGFLGLFMGRGVEVTAAVDTKETKKSLPPPSPPETASARAAPHSSKGGKIDVKLTDTSLPSREENPLLALSKKLEAENKVKEILHSPSPGLSDAIKPIDAEAEKNLSERLRKMESQLQKLTGMIEHLVPAFAAGEIPAVPTRTRALYNHLLEQDVDEHLALSIAVYIADTTDEADDVWTALKSYLTTQIPVASPIELDFNAKRPKVLMLVGPTGVGKTTTLAKISAQYRYAPDLRIRPKIVFVTADLYRLAAVEQLHKYSEILGVELEVTYSPEEVQKALAKHKDAHLIFFDTAGASQRNLPQMSTLAAIAEAAQPTEVHLVLSATTKYSDAVDIVEHFKEIHPTRMIFTKIDESTTFGILLNTIKKFNLPIAYLTTGQNVPEDIETARPERIAKLLLTKPTANRSIEDLAARPDTPSSISQPPAAPPPQPLEPKIVTEDKADEKTSS